MNGHIRMITLFEGRRSVFTAHALFTRFQDKASITYFQEGNRVTLFLTPDRFTMRREGMLAAEFVQGEKTQLFVLHGEEKGTVSIFTTAYAAHFAENSIRVELSYSLDFGNNLQNFQLEILLQSISEVS